MSRESKGLSKALVAWGREARKGRTIPSVADISDREVVVAILAHLGLPTEAPPLARARSPGFDFT
jgi:hypothetical protein